MRVTDKAIQDFFCTLNLGLEWLQDAGKKLVAMLDTNPSAFDDILDADPPAWITRDVLRTIEQIGRGAIAPELLVLPLHVFNRLSSLPTLEQIRAMQEGVDVVKPKNGAHHNFTSQRKLASKLTVKEARQAIGQGRIRTPAEQEAILKNGFHKQPRSLGWFQVEKFINGDLVVSRMDQAPKHGETHRLLVKSPVFAIEFLMQ